MLEKDGWTVAVVERWNAFARVRQDLFGFADLLAMRPSSGFLAVQTTTGSNLSARVEKLRHEARVGIWLASGGKIQLHGWRKLGARGKKKTWQVRALEMFPGRIIAPVLRQTSEPHKID